MLRFKRSKWISSRDPYNIIPIVNNTVLYTWKLVERLEVRVKYPFNNKIKSEWMINGLMEEWMNKVKIPMVNLGCRYCYIYFLEGENRVLDRSSIEEVGEPGFDPVSLCWSTTLKCIWWAHDAVNHESKGWKGSRFGKASSTPAPGRWRCAHRSRCFVQCDFWCSVFAIGKFFFGDICILIIRC